jgi:hypothetical protein
MTAGPVRTGVAQERPGPEMGNLEWALSCSRIASVAWGAVDAGVLRFILAQRATGRWT